MCDRTSRSQQCAPHRKTARRAVFLDRDGTINVEKEYLYRVEEFEFISGVPQALKRLQDAGFLLVVVTNQSGVARGYYTLEDVATLHRHMCNELKVFGVEIAGIYVCPHLPDQGQPPYDVDCNCRKGKPGMLQRAAVELGIDLQQSFMVGDKLADVEAGCGAGCRALLVRTGYGHDVALTSEIGCEADFPDLPVAVNYILK